MVSVSVEQPLKLSGVERAALLVMGLEHDDAVQVLRRLGPREIHRLSRAMTAIREVRRDELQAMLDRFFTDVANTTGLGIDSDNRVRQLLVDALGEERADVLFERVAIGGDTRGLDSLKWLDARSIADFIAREHPQIQSVVIAYLDAAQAAEVLSLLPPEQRLAITTRMAALESVQPAAIEELNVLIEERFSTSTAQPGKAVPGLKAVASVLRHLRGPELDQLLSAIHREDQKLGSDIEELMFVFDDIQSLDAADLRVLLREVSADTLAAALRGGSLELRQKLLANMPRKKAERVRQTLLKPVAARQGDIDRARQEILVIARRMAAAGEIMIDGGRAPSGEQVG